MLFPLTTLSDLFLPQWYHMVDPDTINHMVDTATINHMVDPDIINHMVDLATINHLVDGIKVNQLGGERNFASRSFKG